MMLKEFCLECLFAHSNGKGLLLERFLKTILYHIVPWGRIKDRGQFVPIRSYDAKMAMKFRRIWWCQKAFKLFSDNSSLKEHCMMGTPEKPIVMSKSIFEGHFTAGRRQGRGRLRRRRVPARTGPGPAPRAARSRRPRPARRCRPGR